MTLLRPRLQPDVPRLSPGLLAGVALAHAGLLAALLYNPQSAEPIRMPQALTVSLIEPEIEDPQLKPEPTPQPPRPRVTPLPPPVLVSGRPVPTPHVIETPKPALAPEPMPDVLTPPTPVAEAPKPAPPPPSMPTPPRPADYLNNPRPPYPSLSRRLGEQGIVRLNILVNQDGSVAQLDLLKSSGYPRLDKAAIETVQSSWKFEPAHQGGRPVAAWVIVPIQFTLRS